VLRSVLLGYGVFALFAPGHFPEEAVCVERQPRAVDFVVRQTLTTANFRLGPIARLFASGLGFQIEHHLFPRIDHTRYRAMSCEVRAFCETRGLPYHCLGWGEALRKSFVPFYRPKQVAADLAPPRAPMARERVAF
jgi:fatty acid desaturase